MSERGQERDAYRKSRIADADGALGTLAEGLEVAGVRLPSLGIDLASLAEEGHDRARPALIHLGAVTPDVARALGKALLRAHCMARREAEGGARG